MSRLNGVMVFVALFTVLNEFEQIRYQALVPTKSLVHIEAGMQGIVQSLREHGHAQPAFGFTDNVASDYSTMVRCIPSLAEDVMLPSELGQGEGDLPIATMPISTQLHLCQTSELITQACSELLGLIEDDGSDKLYVGFDIDVETVAGKAKATDQTSAIKIATDSTVYIFKVRKFHTEDFDTPQEHWLTGFGQPGQVTDLGPKRIPKHVNPGRYVF